MSRSRCCSTSGDPSTCSSRTHAVGVTTEVFSIDDVVAIAPDSGETQQFEPLYSHRHANAKRANERVLGVEAPLQQLAQRRTERT